MLHVTGSPEQAATTFLTDWQTRLYAEMDTVTVNAPEGGVAGPLLADVGASSGCAISTWRSAR